MTSIRLRQDQIDRLRSSGMGQAVLRHALMRYRRGDFVIKKSPPKNDSSKILHVYPIYKKPPNLEGWQIREILDCHFAVKDAVLQARIRKEMEAVQKEIDEQMAILHAMAPQGYIDESKKEPVV